MPSSPTALRSTFPAWHCLRYGGPETLVLREQPMPRLRPSDVLVRVHATTVSSGDARLRALRLPRGFGPLGRLIFGWRRPRQPVLGTEFSGTIAAVGERVTAWRVGDAVIGFPGGKMGSHAAYRVMPPELPLVAKPAQLPFTTAAAIGFGGTTARHFLRAGNLRPGVEVLVIGAAGAVGSALLQLARHAGAHVTAVVGPRNVALAHQLGATGVLDRSREDYLAGGERYDIVADTVGATTFRRCAPLLRPHGQFLAIDADLPAMFARPIGTKRSVAGPAPERRDDLQALAELAATGAFVPVIDRIFDFADLPAAHALVDTGHKRGSAVVQLVAETRGPS